MKRVLIILALVATLAAATVSVASANLSWDSPVAAAHFAQPSNLAWD